MSTPTGLKAWSQGRRLSITPRLKYVYGMTLGPGGSVAHKLDSARCRVIWDAVFPEWTKYHLVWICRGKPPAGPIKIFSKVPDGMKLCDSCRDPRITMAMRAKARHRR